MRWTDDHYFNVLDEGEFVHVTFEVFLHSIELKVKCHDTNKISKQLFSYLLRTKDELRETERWGKLIGKSVTGNTTWPLTKTTKVWLCFQLSYKINHFNKCINIKVVDVTYFNLLIYWWKAIVFSINIDLERNLLCHRSELIRCWLVSRNGIHEGWFISLLLYEVIQIGLESIKAFEIMILKTLIVSLFYVLK